MPYMKMYPFLVVSSKVERRHCKFKVHSDIREENKDLFIECEERFRVRNQS